MKSGTRQKVLLYRLYQQHHRCFYCSVDLMNPKIKINADHVTPLKDGRTKPGSRTGQHVLDVPHNIVASCDKCNTRKGDRPPTEDEVFRLEVLNLECTDPAIEAFFDYILRTDIRLFDHGLPRNLQPQQKFGIKA